MKLRYTRWGAQTADVTAVSEPVTRAVVERVAVDEGIDWSLCYVWDGVGDFLADPYRALYLNEKVVGI